MASGAGDRMTEANEQAYIQGNRAAYVDMLRLCLKMLGYDDPESQRAAWILEREATIAQLRDVCAEHGDNDWPDDLNLADVVQKHLANYLVWTKSVLDDSDEVKQ
jgi:hypothetical protein